MPDRREQQQPAADASGMRLDWRSLPFLVFVLAGFATGLVAWGSAQSRQDAIETRVRVLEVAKETGTQKTSQGLQRLTAIETELLLLREAATGNRDNPNRGGPR